MANTQQTTVRARDQTSKSCVITRATQVTASWTHHYTRIKITNYGSRDKCKIHSNGVLNFTNKQSITVGHWINLNKLNDQYVYNKFFDGKSLIMLHKRRILGLTDGLCLHSVLATSPSMLHFVINTQKQHGRYVNWELAVAKKTQEILEFALMHTHSYSARLTTKVIFIESNNCYAR